MPFGEFVVWDWALPRWTICGGFALPLPGAGSRMMVFWPAFVGVVVVAGRGVETLVGVADAFGAVVLPPPPPLAANADVLMSAMASVAPMMGLL